MQESLNILYQAAGRAPLIRDEHEAVKRAGLQLQEFITPKKEAKDEVRKVSKK